MTLAKFIFRDPVAFDMKKNFNWFLDDRNRWIGQNAYHTVVINNHRNRKKFYIPQTQHYRADISIVAQVYNTLEWQLSPGEARSLGRIWCDHGVMQSLQSTETNENLYYVMSRSIKKMKFRKESAFHSFTEYCTPIIADSFEDCLRKTLYQITHAEN